MGVLVVYLLEVYPIHGSVLLYSELVAGTIAKLDNDKELSFTMPALTVQLGAVSSNALLASATHQQPFVEEIRSSSIGPSAFASSAKPAVINLKCSCASAPLSCFSGSSPLQFYLTRSTSSMPSSLKPQVGS